MVGRGQPSGLTQFAEQTRVSGKGAEAQRLDSLKEWDTDLTD
jgi:hypothetical protein